MAVKLDNHRPNCRLTTDCDIAIIWIIRGLGPNCKIETDFYIEIAMAKPVTFDAEGFYGAIDSHRISRSMTWKDVAKASGVSASTLTRMAQGRRPDVDSLAALLSWSGENATSFVRPTASAIRKGKEDTLANVTAQFRADSSLSSEAKRAIETTLKALYEQFREK